VYTFIHKRIFLTYFNFFIVSSFNHTLSWRSLNKHWVVRTLRTWLCFTSEVMRSIGLFFLILRPTMLLLLISGISIFLFNLNNNSSFIYQNPGWMLFKSILQIFDVFFGKSRLLNAGFYYKWFLFSNTHHGYGCLISWLIFFYLPLSLHNWGSRLRQLRNHRFALLFLWCLQISRFWTHAKSHFWYLRIQGISINYIIN